GSGNVWAATVQDTYWNISSGGTVLSSGAIPVFSGQFQTAPMGASTIFISGSVLFTNYNGTWNPAAPGGTVTVASGNTIASVSGATGFVQATPAVPSGLVYITFKLTQAQDGFY